MYGVLIKRKSINSAKWKWINTSAGFVNREIRLQSYFWTFIENLKRIKVSIVAIQDFT